MNLIITSVSVDSTKSTEKIDARTNEDYANGTERFMDGPKSLHATITLEVIASGDFSEVEALDKLQRDSAIAMKIINKSTLTI